MSQRHVLQLSGATAFGGGVLTFVGNIFHPREPGVKQAAADAAREISPNLRVAGVVLSASGSEYAEVIVTVEGCRKDTCQIAVGVRRKAPLSTLRKRLVESLSEHYQAHLAS